MEPRLVTASCLLPTDISAYCVRELEIVRTIFSRCCIELRLKECVA